jgi:hypothetical protein
VHLLPARSGKRFFLLNIYGLLDFLRTSRTHWLLASFFAIILELNSLRRIMLMLRAVKKLFERNPVNQRKNYGVLTHDVWLLVAQYLSYQDLLALFFTSRDMHAALMNDNLIW